MRRESRPWMEMNIRAIPGSHKYVATTGAHHGHAFGSLVLIDPRVEDDGGHVAADAADARGAVPRGRRAARSRSTWSTARRGR